MDVLTNVESLLDLVGFAIVLQLEVMTDIVAWKLGRDQAGTSLDHLEIAIVEVQPVW